MLDRRSTACAAALVLTCASTLSATDTTYVSEGARVRLDAPQISDSRLVGEVTGFHSDTLVILPEYGGSVLTIPWSDIEKIEVSQGKKGNALLGLAAGLAVGAGVGLAICSQDRGNRCHSSGAEDSKGTVIALSTVFFGGLGAGVGALIKTERWQRAEFPAPPPVALNVGKDGSVRLAFSIRL